MKYYEKDIRNKKNMLVRAEYFYKMNFVLTKLIDSRKIKSTLKKLTGEKCIIFKEKLILNHLDVRKTNFIKICKVIGKNIQKVLYQH